MLSVQGFMIGVYTSHVTLHDTKVRTADTWRNGMLRWRAYFAGGGGVGLAAHPFFLPARTLHIFSPQATPSHPCPFLPWVRTQAVVLPNFWVYFTAGEFWAGAVCAICGCSVLNILS